MESFFRKIINVLDINEIPYMLSGSLAMSIYIVPRSTRDFDFVIHLEPKNIFAFVENFKEGYYCDKDSVIDAVNRRSIFNIIDNESGYKADFMILKEEEYRIEEFNRRVKIDFFSKNIFIVSAEDLLLSKIIWIQELQSYIQMDDIKNLSEMETLDWNYINNWIKKLNLNTFNLLNND